MENLENLMWKREHFPVDRNYMTLPVTLPPYHPSLVDGIDPKFIVSVLAGAVLEYIKDLKGVNDKWKESVERCPKFEVHEEDRGLVIAPFPTTMGSQLLIEKERVAMSPYGGDHYIIIHKEDKKIGSIAISGDVPKELQEEYGLEMRGKTLDGTMTRFLCTNRWGYHNVHPLDRILYKNIIIALNNAIVKEKYSKSKPQ